MNKCRPHIYVRMITPDSTTGKVFISYSHQDEQWKDQLVAHLGVLQQQKLLTIWDDRQIAAGDDWQPQIELAMAQAAYYRRLGQFAAGWQDLDEVLEIADYGQMLLHLTDYHLEACRMIHHTWLCYDFAILFRFCLEPGPPVGDFNG